MSRSAVAALPPPLPAEFQEAPAAALGDEPMHPLAAKLQAILTAPDEATIGQMADALRAISREMSFFDPARGLPASEHDPLPADALQTLNVMLAMVGETGGGSSAA